MRCLSFLLLLCGVSTLFGCGGSAEQPFTKTTIRVTGTITVNGKQPEWPVQLEARAASESDPDHPSASNALTDESGSFEFSTYAPGDGVPEGKYYLLAKSREMNLLTRENDGPDKLGGKYDSITKAAHEFDVTAGSEPIDLGLIDLKASATKK